MIARASRSILAAALVLASCGVPAATGSSCARDAECSASLVCRFGRCREACRLHADCPAGQSCLGPPGAGACSLDVDLGCESGVGRACAAGLTCAADHCVSTCTTDAECPADGTCGALAGTAVSVCLDGRALPDAGALDADGHDDGGADAGVDPVIDDLCVTSEFACLASGGGAYCWGRDLGGSLGSGGPCSADTTITTPTRVVTAPGVPLEGVDVVTCEGHFACAHVASGGVYCWGDGSMGTLGNGDTSGCQRVAMPVLTGPGASDVLSLSHADVDAEGPHVCAHGDEGIWCWGTDDLLVDPAGAPATVHAYATPLVVSVGTDVSAIFAVPLGGCITRGDGSLGCWGSNVFARLATTAVPIALATDDPRAAGFVSTALVDIPGVVGATSIAIGDEFGCAVLAGGGLACWGDDRDLELGVAQGSLPDCMGACSAAPVPVPGAAIERLFAGYRSACGVESDGRVQCWGVCDVGQCGQPGGGGSHSIRGMYVTDGASAIHGGTHGALSSTNTCVSGEGDRGVWCWGSERYGVTGHVGVATSDARRLVLGF